MKRIGKRLLSVFLAVVIVFSGQAGTLAGKAAEEEKQEKKYKIGYVRTLFEINGPNLVKIDVLCDEETKTLWIDGSDFVGNLENYSYSYHASEHTVEIRARNKQIGFQVGSNQAAYKVGDCESIYRMTDNVVNYKDRIWIPANSFFYFLGCNVYPQSVTLNESYKPRRDFLVVESPQYTVLDVLYDIFEKDNGLDWMFTYEKDFGVEDWQMENLLGTAKIATGIYGTLTGDLDTILSWTTAPFSDALNGVIKLSNMLFGTDLKTFSSLYDGQFMRKFLTAMLNTSETQMEVLSAETQEQIKMTASITGLIGDISKTVITTEEAKSLVQVFHNLEPDNVWPDFQKYFDEMYESTVQLSDNLDTISAGLTLFKICSMEADIIQRTRNHDSLLSSAMELYLNDSETDTKLPDEVRSALEVQFPTLKSQITYAASESLRASFLEFGPDFLLGKVGLSSVSVVTAMTNVLWYLIEQNNLLPLAKVSEAEAVQMAVYAMMYEQDAWRELAISYQDIALNNGLNDYEELKEAAYMAANYLKSCYVATESGLESLKSADFAQSYTYTKAKTKLRQLAEMISALSEDIQLAEGTSREVSRGYGVLLGTRRGRSNELTYDLFMNPSKMVPEKSYGSYQPPLNEPSLNIYPVVIFPNYYEFIRDEILPERGYVSLETAANDFNYENSQANLYWDKRSGLLGADILDLNQDDTEDLLLYYYGEYQRDPAWEKQENCLIVELYTMDEDGEIYLVSSQFLDCHYGLSHDSFSGGIMELDGKYYLYTENYSSAYFADGDYLGYDFYEYASDGTFQPKWQVCKSDGGSSDIAYSLMTRTTGDTYDKFVLHADGGFRQFHPDVPVYTSVDSPLRPALNYGFSQIGLYASMDSIYGNVEAPSYMMAFDLITPSFSFLCTGTLSDDGYRHMQVTLSDYTQLKKHIDELDQPESSGEEK